MHGHGRQVVLAGQHKGHAAVGDEGQLLSFGVMDRIKMLAPLRSGLQIGWKIGHIDGLDVDDTLVCVVEIKRCVHVFYPLRMLMV